MKTNRQSFISYISRLIFYAGIAPLLIFTLASCVNEDLGVYNPDSDNSDAIHVRAAISGTGNTRTYYGQEAIDIDKGLFYLTYPQNDGAASISYSKYGTAKVNFGNSEDPTTGYAYYEKDGVKKDLKWSKVYGEGRSSVSLYLHNINPECYSLSGEGYHPNGSEYQKYNFKTTNNPYVASPLDKENGTNDLIIAGGTTMGGYVSSVNSSSNIYFNLYHRMALLKVSLEVYSADDGHVSSLDNAEVYIGPLYRKLKSINLRYCTDYYIQEESVVSKKNSSERGSYGAYGDLGEVTLIGDTEEGGSYGWEKVKDDTGNEYNYTEEEYTDELNQNYIKRTYSVPDFVFPPQVFNANEPPQLIVRVPKKDITGASEDENEFITYSGYIPKIMYDTDADGNITSWTPVDTRLNSGYVLHLTATIDSPNTELNFAPVRIENWVTKGTFNVSTKKAGIYSAKDFMKLIEAYTQGKTYELEKYGFVENGNYIFQIWANFSIDSNEIKGKMPLDPTTPLPFSFLLNSYRVTLQDLEPETGEIIKEEELEGISGQQKLYQTVTGTSNTSYTGIRNAEDMLELISLCHERDGYTAPDKMKLIKFGSLNTYDNLWTFRFEGDMTLDIEDIFQKIDPNFLRADCVFERNGHSVKVNIGSKQLNCEYDSEFDEFTKLAVPNTTFGIYKAGDFYLLTKCYNEFYTEYPDLLTLYGEKSATAESWTFYFRSNMTLDGNKAFVSMTPDETNGKPAYSISTKSPYYDITFDHPQLAFTVKTSSSPQNIFKGTGHASSYTSLNYIITAYQANNYLTLWAYGRFVDGAWTFTMDYKSGSTLQYGTYSTMFGSMVPKDNEGKFDYNFYLGDFTFQVREMPKAKDATETETRNFTQNGSTTSSYPNSAEDLKKVTNGTYWDEEEEPGEP